MEMLKKFEEEDLAADEELDEGDDEEDPNWRLEREELERKLDGVDLDSLSPTAVLELLSPSQREAFIKTIQDPAKISALVESEFEGDRPWWEDEKLVSEEIDVREEDNSSDAESLADASLFPPLVDVSALPHLKIGENGEVLVNPQLVYNISAVLLAYSYVLRTFSLRAFAFLPTHSAERVAATELIATLVPLLVEKSNVLLPDVGSSIDYVVGRAGISVLSPRLLPVLMRDLASLVVPSTITTVAASNSSLSSHPSANALLAFSDLYNLFSSPPSPTLSTTPSPLLARPSGSSTKTSPTGPLGAKLARLKLLFYIAVLSSPRSNVTGDTLRSIAETMREEGEKRADELADTEEQINLRAETRGGGTSDQVEEQERKGPTIAEIP